MLELRGLRCGRRSVNVSGHEHHAITVDHHLLDPKPTRADHHEHEHLGVGLLELDALLGQREHELGELHFGSRVSRPMWYMSSWSSKRMYIRSPRSVKVISTVRSATSVTSSTVASSSTVCSSPFHALSLQTMLPATLSPSSFQQIAAQTEPLAFLGRPRLTPGRCGLRAPPHCARFRRGLHYVFTIVSCPRR